MHSERLSYCRHLFSGLGPMNGHKSIFFVVVFFVALAWELKHLIYVHAYEMGPLHHHNRIADFNQKLCVVQLVIYGLI